MREVIGNYRLVDQLVSGGMGWYKLYMPYADDATKPRLQEIIDKFGG